MLEFRADIQQAAASFEDLADKPKRKARRKN